jgi:DNA-binding NtrC family response regulator
MMRIIPVRTLVIDDDDAVCRKVGGWLRESACDVVTFTDPDAALTHASRAPGQVGLIDLRLGGTDGVSVVAALGKAAPEMRLIAMSAFPDAKQVIAAMRAGARDLLEKPIQREALLAALERQLAEVGVQVRSEDEFNRRLGARVRSVRSQAKRTLAAVAGDCGLTVAQLSQIELGKSATSTWGLARICSALATPMDRLLRDL